LVNCAGVATPGKVLGKHGPRRWTTSSVSSGST
jgi:hypothetical protein